jgi:hypothetical protein
MIQERREKRLLAGVDAVGSAKAYIPWTMFTAPDGKLPFWKPHKRRNKASIMVHEGAKTAAFVDGLLNDPARREERDRYPWAKELSHFEHWGAIGGALAIHRCDFDELKREKIDGDLIYVYDRDLPGEEAAKTFSKLWGGRLLAIKFDNTFRPGWDLADAVPAELINKDGTAKKRLMDFVEPATWATVALPKTSKRANQGYALSEHFKAEWCHSVKPKRFHHVSLPIRSLTAEEFDDKVRPFSDVETTSRYVAMAFHGQALEQKYHPAPGLCSDDGGGRSFVNTYVPSKVRDYSKEELAKLRRSDTDFAAPFQRFLDQPDTGRERAPLRRQVGGHDIGQAGRQAQVRPAARRRHSRRRQEHAGQDHRRGVGQREPHPAAGLDYHRRQVHSLGRQAAHRHPRDI